MVARLLFSPKQWARLAHQDRTDFGWLTKPAEKSRSETTQKGSSVLESLF